MSKKWKRFIKENEHYCPHCPEEERDETYIATFDLKEFLKEEAKKKTEVKKDRASFILKSGYDWVRVHGGLSNQESVMLGWKLADWVVVTEKFSPTTRDLTLEDIAKVHKLIRKEFPDADAS